MVCKTPLLGSELCLRSWRLLCWFERLCLSRCLETSYLVVFSCVLIRFLLPILTLPGQTYAFKVYVFVDGADDAYAN